MFLFSSRAQDGTVRKAKGQLLKHRDELDLFPIAPHNGSKIFHYGKNWWEDYE